MAYRWGGGAELSHSKAFTLAEVLITLAIIGIVAAMTMPTLIASHQEKVTVTKVKKFYSVMQNAFDLAVNDYGPPEDWDLKGNNSAEGAMNIALKLKPYLKLTAEPEVNSLFTGINEDGAIMKLADGTIVKINTRSADCTQNRGRGSYARSCALVRFKINNDMNSASTSSKQYASQVFIFVMTNDGFLPRGLPDDNNPFETGCKISSGLGDACAAWVIYKENLDYLYCEDLAWNGKTKCK